MIWFALLHIHSVTIWGTTIDQASTIKNYLQHSIVVSWLFWSQVCSTFYSGTEDNLSPTKVFKKNLIRLVWNCTNYKFTYYVLSFGCSNGNCKGTFESSGSCRQCGAPVNLNSRKKEIEEIKTNLLNLRLHYLFIYLWVSVCLSVRNVMLFIAKIEA